MTPRAPCLIVTLLCTLLALATTAAAGERWVSAVTTTAVWNSFPCTDYWITDVCGVDKGFGDPGSLPPVVAVGDTIHYTNAKGQPVAFRVRSISFFVYDKNLDATWGGQRFTAKKGDTSCFIYSSAARSNMDYASKITIRGCQLVSE